jgi:hypothetical protein
LVRDYGNGLTTWFEPIIQTSLCKNKHAGAFAEWLLGQRHPLKTNSLGACLKWL